MEKIMEYIVMDLEWNQNPYGKNNFHPEIPFEIIEIGAVRMSLDGEILDSFKEVIRPRIYRKLHYRTKEITHFTEEELMNGKSFRRVIRNFLEWCGDDFMFCTWGSMDLTELQRNMKYYKMERVLDYPLFYLDLQKIYSLTYSDGRKKTTLTEAVKFLNVEDHGGFHRALDDAIYTAKVFKNMEPGRFIKRLSIDTFYPPRLKEEEIFVKFDEYTKLVTSEFLSKESILEDPEVGSYHCNQCGKEMEPIIPWFSDSGKTYFCLARCQEHGLSRGKIKVKKYEDDSFFAIKIMKSTDEEGAEKIKERQELLREKRRERRQRANEKDSFNNAWESEEKFNDDDEDDD